MAKFISWRNIRDSPIQYFLFKRTNRSEIISGRKWQYTRQLPDNLASRKNSKGPKFGGCKSRPSREREPNRAETLSTRKRCAEKRTDTRNEWKKSKEKRKSAAKISREDKIQKKKRRSKIMFYVSRDREVGFVTRAFESPEEKRNGFLDCFSPVFLEFSGCFVIIVLYSRVVRESRFILRLWNSYRVLIVWW